MLCPDLKNTSPLIVTHNSVGNLDHLVILLLCLTAMLTGATPARRTNVQLHHTCPIPDSCNAGLPICTRLCMGSINYCEFSACSFLYFDCLFLSLPRSSLRSFFFAATAVAFSSASLALVSASSAMAPSQDRHSASPATLLSARHPSQATSIFLAAVVPEAMLAHLKLLHSQLHFPDVS